MKIPFIPLQNAFFSGLEITLKSQVSIIDNMFKLSAIKNFFIDRIVLIIIMSYTLIFTILMLPVFVIFNLSFELSFLIALFSFSINRLIDYKSTLKVIKEIDKDFTEYKFEKYYRELSPTLSSHPSEKEVKSLRTLLLNILLFGILFGLPLIIYHTYQYGTDLCLSFLLAAPIIYLNNSLMTRNIQITKMIVKDKR